MRKGEEEGKSEVGVPGLHLTHDSYYYFTPSATHTETSLSLLFFMLSCFPPQSLSLPVCLSVCLCLAISFSIVSFFLSHCLVRASLTLPTYLSVCEFMYSRLSFCLFSPSHFLLFSHCLLNQKHVAGTSRLQTLFSTLRLPFVQYGKWK